MHGTQYHAAAIQLADLQVCGMHAQRHNRFLTMLAADKTILVEETVSAVLKGCWLELVH